MLKQVLTLQNKELNRPLPKEKIKKVIALMEDELGGKIMEKFVGLRKKTYSCLIDSCLIDDCLETTQLEDKINHLEKNEIDVDNLNVFTEEINKIALSSNNDKRMQSIDLTETYACGTSKDLVSKNKEIKCSNTIKQ